MEQERHSTEKWAKLWKRLVQATENDAIAKEEIDPKLQSNLDQNAVTAFMYLYPEDTMTNPVAVSKIRAFIANPDNLAILQECIEKNGDIVALKEKIGLQPKGPLNQDGQATEITVDPALKKDEQTPMPVSEAEKNDFLQSIEETSRLQSTRQEVNDELVVAKQEYEDWINEHTTRYVPQQERWRQWEKNQEHEEMLLQDKNTTLWWWEGDDNVHWYSSWEDAWESGVNVRVMGDTTTWFYLVTEADTRVEETGYSSNFPTRAKARWAERRYELYSEPPLDEIRGMGPDYIDTIKQMPEIQSLWIEQNPNEPFTAKGLRRLLLVGLLKRMNPEKYQDKSYNAIVHGQTESLTKQFDSVWQANPLPGIRNTGEKGIKEILAIVKNPDLWKKDTSVPWWPPDAL